MTLTKKQIMVEAMKLDPFEREALAGDILLSIQDSNRDEIDAAWLSEARRRDAAFRTDASRAKPVDEVVERLAGKGRR